MSADTEARPGTDPVLLLNSRDVIRSRHWRDRSVVPVALIAAAMAVASTVYYFRHDQLLGYQDSYSHLEIARRILTAQTTGLAQLGGIWLPLPHLLEALFAWNWTLYRTGLAGSIVNGAAFVVSTVYLYRIVLALKPGRRMAAFAGAMVFATNANMLYQQATAMDELPLFAFTLAAVYGLINWVKTRRAACLLGAAVGSMGAMLCRYEAWFLAIVYLITTVIMARRMGYNWRDVRGLGLVFAVIGVACSAIGWLLYNWLIFGSPVNFLYGSDSSADQMSHFVGDTEKGSWSRTLDAYGTTLQSDLGWFVIVLAIAGLVVFIARERFSAKSLPVLALASVIPFYIYSLESGQEPLEVPALNDALLNLRFGLIALLPAAILIGYLLGSLPKWPHRASSAALCAALAALCLIAIRAGNVVLPYEAVQDNNAQAYQAEAAAFLENDTSGRILINLTGNERVAFPVLKRLIYEGSKGPDGPLWQVALTDPQAEQIQVIVMRYAGAAGQDEIYQDLRGTRAMAAYHLVYKNADYEVFALAS